MEFISHIFGFTTLAQVLHPTGAYNYSCEVPAEQGDVENDSGNNIEQTRGKKSINHRFFVDVMLEKFTTQILFGTERTEPVNGLQR